MVQLSVVVPAFNEERRLQAAVNGAVAYLAPLQVTFEIIIVDDGSTDATSTVIGTLEQRFSQVRSIRLPVNSGKGAAVKAGMMAAQGAHVLFTDADQSTSIDQLPRVMSPVVHDGFDIAMGSRALAASRIVVGQKWYRQALARGFGAATRILFVRGFRDCQCGFKLFTRDAARMLFPMITSRTAIFDMELMLLAARKGYRIAEVPIDWRHDPDSRLTYSFWTSLGLLRELLRMKLHWRVTFAPKASVTQCESPASLTDAAAIMARTAPIR